MKYDLALSEDECDSDDLDAGGFDEEAVKAPVARGIIGAPMGRGRGAPMARGAAKPMGRGAPPMMKRKMVAANAVPK